MRGGEYRLGTGVCEERAALIYPWEGGGGRGEGEGGGGRGPEGRGRGRGQPTGPGIAVRTGSAQLTGD